MAFLRRSLGIPPGAGRRGKVFVGRLGRAALHDEPTPRRRSCSAPCRAPGTAPGFRRCRERAFRSSRNSSHAEGRTTRRPFQDLQAIGTAHRVPEQGNARGDRPGARKHRAPARTAGAGQREHEAVWRAFVQHDRRKASGAMKRHLRSAARRLELPIRESAAPTRD